MSDKDMMQMFLAVGEKEKSKKLTKEEIKNTAETMYTLYSSLVEAGFSDTQAMTIFLASIAGGR